MIVTILVASIIFTAPEGWRARLGKLDPAKVTWIAKTADSSPCGPGSARRAKLMNDDAEGFWVSCHIKGLEGKKIEVWRETRVVLRFADGKVLKSSRIIAAVDPCGFQLLDNAVTPFLVTERTHGYNGAATLYVRFDEKFDLDQMVSWHFSMARTKVAPASPQERQGQPK